MDPVREARAAEIFADALELPADQRMPFLATTCSSDRELYQRVASLLAAHPKGKEFFDSTRFREEMGAVAASVVGRELGRRIGPYELTRLLGTGGMGSVYLAERRDGDFQQRVALKLIHPGAFSGETLTRFRTERQMLARLEHPNIAHLIDGGTLEDGLPFLVMEYVDGVRIDRYCREQALDFTARLQLFRAVCEAVQYAHRNLVVHRDLKPSNILVDSQGAPKLLDFGIAKLVQTEESQSTGEVTATAVRLMTPRYASPEQLLGRRISTASDVYSLGVLLFELLTEQSPYRSLDTAPVELIRAVCEESPLAPSAAVMRPLNGGNGKTVQPVEVRSTSSRRKLSQQLKGDLDTIVLKALRKEPERRYTSVEEFAGDIRRSLQGLPVHARPDTVTYRASKFIRRNKVLVGGTTMVFVSLAAGLVISLSLYGEALRTRRQEAFSRAEAERFAQMSSLAAAESSIRTNRLVEAQRLLQEIPPEDRGWEWRHLEGRVDRSRMALRAHEVAITTLAYAPDGTFLVTASDDSTLKRWDPRTGDLLGRWGPLASVPRSLAFSRDGAFLAVGLEDGRVEVFDVARGQVSLKFTDPLQKLPAALTKREYHEDSEMAMLDRAASWPTVKFHPQRNLLAAGFYTGRVIVYDMESKSPVATWKSMISGSTTKIRFSPDGRWLLKGSDYVPLSLWDFESQQLVRVLGDSIGQVDLCFSPDGRRIAAVYQDQRIEVWETTTGKHVSTLRSHGGSIRAVEFDPKGEFLLSSATDRQVCLWNVAARTIRAEFRGHASSVHTIVSSPEGDVVATADWDGFLRFWSWDTEDVHTIVFQVPTYRRMWSKSLDLSPDGTRMLLVDIGQSVSSWNLATRSHVRDYIIQHERGPLRAFRAVYSSDAQQVLVGSMWGALYIFHAQNGDERARIEAHAGDVRGIDVHPQGGLFATGGADSLVRIWEFGATSPQYTLRGHGGLVFDVCFSPSGSWLASASADGTIRLWDVATGRPAGVLEGHAGAVRGVAFSPDASLLASASVDGSVKLWDVRMGHLVSTPVTEGEPFYSLAYTHDGSRVAAGDEDGEIVIIDPASGHERMHLNGHAARIFSLQFAPDDASLVSTSLDGTIRIWDCPVEGREGAGALTP